MTAQPSETPAAAQTPSVQKRPSGITAIALIWVVFGMVNLYLGWTNLASDLSAYPLLSIDPSGLNATQLAALNWLQAGLPADTGLSALGVVIGLLQFLAAYGLWVGFRWSYRVAFAVVVLLPASWVAEVVLYDSAPAVLGLSSPVLYSGAFSSFIWLFFYLRYLRNPLIRAYLHLEDEVPEGVPPSVAPVA